jgi:hypothetical protein
MRYPIGDWLWFLARIEARAVVAATRLAKSPLLTEDERAEARRIVEDEIRHRDLALRYARQWARPPAKPTPDYGTDLETLLYMSRGEGALIRAWDRFRKHLPEEFDFIVADERRHRAWSRGILHRLRSEGVKIPRCDRRKGIHGEGVRLAGLFA